MDQATRLKKLQELKRLKRIDACFNDLDTFVDTYLSHLRTEKTPSFHREICKQLDEDNTRDLFVAPRGFAKSTIASRFLPIFLVATGRSKDIFLVSATVSLAKEHTRVIRTEFESNELLRGDFGNLVSDKWTEEHLVFSNGCQIRAKGRGFQIRGFRPDTIICDDLEDDELIYSKEQRDKIEAWFFRTLLPALKPQQRLIYIGTILHQYSLINKLAKKPEFKMLKFKAITDGQSIWEELFPTDYLFNLRKEIGTYAFEAEYQNNPIALDTQPIKPEYLDTKKTIGRRVVRCLALDPAISEREVADFSAITIFDRLDDNTFREVHSYRGRHGIDALTDKIFELFFKFEPERVLLEEIAFQKIIRYTLTEKGKQFCGECQSRDCRYGHVKGVFLPIGTAKVGREHNNKYDKRPMDKMSRLLQVIHLFEQRLVHIENDDVRQELLGFPFADHDDLVDATVFSLYWLMKYQKGAFVSQSEGRNVPVKSRKAPRMKELPNGEVVMVHEEVKINTSGDFISALRGK